MVLVLVATGCPLGGLPTWAFHVWQLVSPRVSILEMEAGGGEPRGERLLGGRSTRGTAGSFRTFSLCPVQDQFPAATQAYLAPGRVTRGRMSGTQGLRICTDYWEMGVGVRAGDRSCPSWDTWADS